MSSPLSRQAEDGGKAIAAEQNEPAGTFCGDAENIRITPSVLEEALLLMENLPYAIAYGFVYLRRIFK